MDQTLLLDALACKNSSRPPVWIMRQAGRYLPEYRAIREKHSFMEMCHIPEIAAEITLQPIRRFGMDAAILFSDILHIADAAGGGLQFIEKTGPVFSHPVALNQIPPSIDVKSKLQFVPEAIKILKKELTIPLIGFCGAPFTVASYWIEGQSSRDLKTTKQWLYRHPDQLHTLLQILTDASIEYLQMQIDQGVNAIQVFDSWANVLSPSQFQTFAAPYLKQITEAVQKTETPVILFCRGTSSFIEPLSTLNPDGISCDWSVSLPHIHLPKVALQGNFDPCLLYADPTEIQKQVKQQLDKMHNHPGYICNLGHGILPDMSIEAVHTFVDTIQNWRKP